jgi:hypothetical protein
MVLRVSFRALLFFCITLFCSCSNKSETNLSVYRAFASSLNNSNSFITNENILLIKQIEEKLAEPSTVEKAKFWYPRALAVQQKSNVIIEYIDSLKMVLKKEAGLTLINNRESFREDDIKSVKILFDKKGRAKELKQRLQTYESEVLAIDPEMASIFQNTINLTIRLSDPSEKSLKTFNEIFFKNIPAVAAIAVLVKFQNNVKLMENELIAFCNNKTPSPS